MVEDWHVEWYKSEGPALYNGLVSMDNLFRTGSLLERTLMNTDQGSESKKKDWRRTVGRFSGLQEVFAEAMKLREADRKKARHRPKKVVRSKS